MLKCTWVYVCCNKKSFKRPFFVELVEPRIHFDSHISSLINKIKMLQIS